mmetsp:Transcript_19763/g.34848  ORF Transcript_19763/g.34848 Transcript_19763/m.34848 type:complete len:92 (-) Transcript_19763:2242-2517(-)
MYKFCFGDVITIPSALLSFGDLERPLHPAAKSNRLKKTAGPIFLARKIRPTFYSPIFFVAISSRKFESSVFVWLCVKSARLPKITIICFQN